MSFTHWIHVRRGWQHSQVVRSGVASEHIWASEELTPKTHETQQQLDLFSARNWKDDINFHRCLVHCEESNRLWDPWHLLLASDLLMSAWLWGVVCNWKSTALRKKALQGMMLSTLLVFWDWVGVNLLFFGGMIWSGLSVSLSSDLVILQWTTSAETNSSPLEIGLSQKETSIPTIHFQVLLLLVSGRLITYSWWFQIFLIFTLTWGNDPIWLIFFRWVGSTTT